MNLPIDVAEIDKLVSSTCQLWPAGWVAYNWRNYTYDHIQRVRGLTLQLAQREGGNLLECELAALLHDVTKLYDGEYLTDAEGKRLVDDGGYWISATRQPLGANEVTRLYDRLGLAGQVHSRSGAAVAWHLLRKRGLGYLQREHVAEAIREHLAPGAGASQNALCLYDADLIDANIGLPAFVRHIYIHRHFSTLRQAPGQPAYELLASSPRTYLEPYVRDSLPRWIEGKQRDFPPQLRTAAGRQLVDARLRRIASLANELQRELDAKPADALGGLAVLEYLLGRSEEPSIAEEISILSNGWAGTLPLTYTARQFIHDLAAEAAGIM